MSKVVGFMMFAIQPGPLAAAHARVADYAVAAVRHLGETASYRVADPASLEEGRLILAFDQRMRIDVILAALVQAAYYERQWWDRSDELLVESKRLGKDAIRNPALRAKQLNHLSVLLTRPTLPFTSIDLTSIVDAILSAPFLNAASVPIDAIVKHLVKRPLTPELIAPLGRLRDALASTTGDKLARRLTARLDDLLMAAADNEAPAFDTPARPLVRAAAGDDGVLRSFKHLLGLLPAAETPITSVGPDRFPLSADSPLHAEHGQLTELFEEFAVMPDWGDINLPGSSIGRKIAILPAEARTRVLLALLEREIHALLQRPTWEDEEFLNACQYAGRILENLVATKVSLTDRANVFDLALGLSIPHQKSELAFLPGELRLLIDAAEGFDHISPLTDGERYALSLLRARVAIGSFFGKSEADAARLDRLVGDGLPALLPPGPAWVRTLHEQIRDAGPAATSKWRRLMKHLVSTSSSRPSAAWTKKALALMDDIGRAPVTATIAFTLATIGNGYVDPAFDAFDHLQPRYGGARHDLAPAILDGLIGLLWAIAALRLGDADTARATAATAAWAYKKLPGVGPQAIRVGNAAVYALSAIGTADAVGQLAKLKARVKFGTAQKEIEKAFNVAAEALGLPRDQIEELGVPTYGLEDVGVRRETFGDATAELRVNGRDVSIAWTKGGKAVKSVPAKVKSDFKDDLKELQAAAKDIAAILPAQSERLDAMFLSREGRPAAAWRERYLDHPLVGTLARRLIWTDGRQAFAWHDGRLVGVDDNAIDLADDADVSLWHPIDRPTTEVLAWRDWLTRHEVRQPFKQAHREVYVLTDAERNTETYSNRFAAHVLRQHQFNALCAARGWRNKLRLIVDDYYPPASRELPQWGLRAEFWIEGIGDDYGTDTTDSGSYLRVATDQVRFYRTGDAINTAHAGGGGYAAPRYRPDATGPTPLRLADVPALVLSEVMRDVDLFVGVASVGNDPTWQDGGPGGRFRDYWQTYSFGDLNETAKTRRDVLTGLLPRLAKLKGRWELGDKFLTIRGDLRTYNIHLGSGNILMEPNDQYLCIVADRSTTAGDGVFLPFEGDNTLSIILSKAFLLAADTKITDSTITRQIKQA